LSASGAAIVERDALVRYAITPSDPEAHLYAVTCTVAHPDPAGQRFALPAWIPGSYMIREFARHVVSAEADSRGHRVALRKTDKHTWMAARVSGPLTLRWRVYAFDLSVRGAFLDTERGFFNGPCVFPRVLGQEHRACEVDLQPPRGAHYRHWRVATSLRRVETGANGFGRHAAGDYDELIDHPVEMGTFAHARFVACGVPHEIAIAGRQRADLDRLTSDFERLASAHIRLWHGPNAGQRGGERPPMDRYVFLVHALDEGYGGLEHRASTALVCARDELPVAGETPGEAYRGFLGLASHEYFHTWNVKRIKPAAFTPYDLERESYTALLWAFEGITSYYDDLLLVRCGLVTEREYLEILGRSLTSLARTPGREVQTVAEASFDAWIKYYRQDENSPNALVSYYLKGSLIALALDLLLRSRTNGARSLDDVMRALWHIHGRTGVGVPEGGIERVAESVAGFPLRRFFDLALRSTASLPLPRLLAAFGIRTVRRPAESAGDRGGRAPTKSAAALRGRAAFGARTTHDALGAKIANVYTGGAAERAGLCAGDVIVAIDGLRVTAAAIDARLERCRPGQRIEVQAFRRDRLIARDVALLPAPADTFHLEIDARGGSDARRLRERWLGGGTRHPGGVTARRRRG
jgi:predicted metalloprotease with PDZ domain